MKSKDGLTKFRKQTAKKPEHHCDNCGCHRYSPCYCKVCKKKKEK